MIEEVGLARAANQKDIEIAADGIRAETAVTIAMAALAIIATIFSRPKMPEMKIHLFHHNV